MKRLTILMLAFVASMALPTHVSAQFDLGKAFKSLIGGDDEPTPYELIAQNAPAASDVVGTWVYNGADIEYFGSNVLADYAISEAKSYALSEVRKAGVTPGSAVMTIKRNGNAQIKWKDETLSGKYVYDDSNGSLQIIAEIEGKQVKCDGFVRLSGDTLTVLIDANDVVEAYKSLRPGDTDSSALSIAEGILDTFSQIYGAGVFVRRK